MSRTITSARQNDQAAYTAPMRQSERLSAILEALSTDGTVGVSGAGGLLGVSAATVRRDLELLERQKLLEPNAWRRGRRRRAVRAAAALQDGPPSGRETSDRVGGGRLVVTRRAIGLTGGTTTTEVARAVIDRQRLTVVTNALNIASELAIRPEPQAGRHGRVRAYRVLRTGRPTRRAVAGRAEPRRRVPGHRRYLGTTPGSRRTTRWRRTRTSR